MILVYAVTQAKEGYWIFMVILPRSRMDFCCIVQTYYVKVLVTSMRTRFAMQFEITEVCLQNFVVLKASAKKKIRSFEL